tara:strand:- start:791 stop:1024 length:234 start_codon:yes stop_codon:yes gene_type:complete
MDKDAMVEMLIDSLLRIENERKLLAEEQKVLFEGYKDKLDVKAVKAALRIAKIRSRLGDSEAELDSILETVESKVTI